MLVVRRKVVERCERFLDALIISRCKRGEARAAHQKVLVTLHVAHRTQLADVATAPAQERCRGVFATVGEGRWSVLFGADLSISSRKLQTAADEKLINELNQ